MNVWPATLGPDEKKMKDLIGIYFKHALHRTHSHGDSVVPLQLRSSLWCGKVYRLLTCERKDCVSVVISVHMRTQSFYSAIVFSVLYILCYDSTHACLFTRERNGKVSLVAYRSTFRMTFLSFLFSGGRLLGRVTV